VSCLITFLLTFGWIRFTYVPPAAYQLWFFGLPMVEFPIEAGTGFALFHALDWTAVLLIIGVAMALWRRMTAAGVLTTQRFGFDLMPMVLLLTIAVTGLALTASSLWWEGKFYGFISLTHAAVAVYSGSSMTNEKCYLVGKFARVALGTRRVDYNGRLCMSAAAIAYAKAFGVDRAPLPMTDIPLADCRLVVSANVAECFPIVMRWIWQARDRGARLIVLDPRETPTARTADLWLPIRSGTDIAVLNAMLRQLIHDGLVDAEYVACRTTGWEAVPAAVEPYTPERAQQLAGVPAERIVAAARLFGRAAASSTAPTAWTTVWLASTSPWRVARWGSPAVAPCC
jgi:hypothetical protein